MQNLSSPYIALPIPEKLKIRLVFPGNSMLIGRPLKKVFKKIKKHQQIYSLPGKFVGGLSYM